MKLHRCAKKQHHNSKNVITNCDTMNIKIQDQSILSYNRCSIWNTITKYQGTSFLRKFFHKKLRFFPKKTKQPCLVDQLQVLISDISFKKYNHLWMDEFDEFAKMRNKFG